MESLIQSLATYPFARKIRAQLRYKVIDCLLSPSNQITKANYQAAPLRKSTATYARLTLLSTCFQTTMSSPSTTMPTLLRIRCYRIGIYTFSTPRTTLSSKSSTPWAHFYTASPLTAVDAFSSAKLTQEIRRTVALGPKKMGSRRWKTELF